MGSANSCRYVILRHAAPDDQRGLHWDLMLEAGDVLRTWALEQEPDCGVAGDALALTDHRQIYLDYEGPISGERGWVSKWDAGTFRWEVDNLREVVVALAGQRLRGKLTLSRRAGQDQRWRVFFSAE